MVHPAHPSAGRRTNLAGLDGTLQRRSRCECRTHTNERTFPSAVALVGLRVMATDCQLTMSSQSVGIRVISMLVALIRLDLNDDFDRVAWWMMRRVVECGRLVCVHVRCGGVQMEKHAGSFQFKQCEMLKSHLTNLGIEDCIAMLNAAHIDLEMFKKMTEEDLLDAGIKAGPIRVIMNERNQVVTLLTGLISSPITFTVAGTASHTGPVRRTTEGIHGGHRHGCERA